MLQHKDLLVDLNSHNSVSGKIRSLHKVMKQHYPFLTRIAVALYDAGTDSLRTFVWSSAVESKLTHYEAKLKDCTSLYEIAKSGEPLVVHDLSVYSGSGRKHTQVVIDSGYLSSYTFPMIWDGSFFGFVFFNADKCNAFEERVLSELDVMAHMITLLIYNERSNVRTLLATIKSTLQITHTRDPETGAHIERMSRYARLIARELAEKYELDDQYVEHIFLFSPLHDVGKIKIPDSILLKQAALTPQEYEIMKTHSTEGRHLIDVLLSNYGLNGVTHVQMLRNIALHHHEAMDGSGYPDHLEGDQIPLEARIVTVADIFDALTSRRPYKEAWTNEEAFAKLRELAKNKLDPDCVEALLNNEDAIKHIQTSFVENQFG